MWGGEREERKRKRKRKRKRRAREETWRHGKRLESSPYTAARCRRYYACSCCVVERASVSWVIAGDGRGAPHRLLAGLERILPVLENEVLEVNCACLAHLDLGVSARNYREERRQVPWRAGSPF
jgi:hypothetical protein